MSHSPHPPSLFSIELRTARWEMLVDWYRDVLGLKVLLRVVDDHYALLDAGDTRLAIMGRATPGEASGRWSLGFETGDLDAAGHRLGAAAEREVGARQQDAGVDHRRLDVGALLRLDLQGHHAAVHNDAVADLETET